MSQTCVRRGDTDMMRQHKQWGVLDPSSDSPGFGQMLWNIEANQELKLVPEGGATTMLEVLEKSKEKFGERRATGWREVVKVHSVMEGDAKREKIELANEYQWLSYADYYARVLNLARGFSFHGLKPKSKVVIYAETQVDWMVSAFAAFMSNATVVTIYATLGEEGAVHGINETEASIVITDNRLLKVLAKVLPKCSSVKTVLTMTDPDDDMATKITEKGVKLDSIKNTIDAGKTWSEFRAEKPSPDDVAVIMYTSGTTGTPKGVMLKHSNICAVVAGVEHAMRGVITCEDVYLSYLPLAHVMEMGAEVAMMSMGAALGFGSPHTLTDNALKLKRPESVGDAPLLGPTFMVFAPAVLDKIYNAINAKKDEAGMVGRTLFNWGLCSGERHFQRGKVGANRIYNGIVFKKVQRLLGGRLKAMITGSAPLSGDIQKFIQTVLDVPVRQGYGLTETCAGSCVAFWGDNSIRSVGPPTVTTVVRLADWEEGAYLNSDKDKPEIGMRRGEILIGGPTVSPGYFISTVSPNKELQKKNEEDWVTVNNIRYFRTGDIGQIHANGTLEIIDRKKDLWKGPNGEYVAFTKVEAALQLCEYVDVPMCYGRTGADHPVALICPFRPKLLALGEELAVGSNDVEVLCKDKRIVERVTAACKAACKEQKLLEFETPKKFALIADPWTPENDMLTAALKLKRPLIAQRHKAEIDELYA